MRITCGYLPAEVLDHENDEDNCATKYEEPDKPNDAVEFIKKYIQDEGIVVTDDFTEANNNRNVSENETETEKKIKDVLENYVKPAVEMDGGFIQFKSYHEGRVNLILQGSCSGCPSSMITLKSGIEGLLKRLVPEVKEVDAEAQ